MMLKNIWYCVRLLFILCVYSVGVVRVLRVEGQQVRNSSADMLAGLWRRPSKPTVADSKGGIDMDQVETFRGLTVPRLNPQTQLEWCKRSSCQSECSGCIFDYNRPETLEPFTEWMETRKNGR
jgi:hypothetical protein